MSSHPSYAWPKQTALAPCQPWNIPLAWAVSLKIPVRCSPPRFITPKPVPAEVVYTEVSRLPASALSGQATGH